ncbi:MAG: FAD-binding protein [Planctomycetota bacterium]|nr:MAG: FAD-binding protein [Planctomycetota bacterium]
MGAAAPWTAPAPALEAVGRAAPTLSRAAARRSWSVAATRTRGARARGALALRPARHVARHALRRPGLDPAQGGRAPRAAGDARAMVTGARPLPVADAPRAGRLHQFWDVEGPLSLECDVAVCGSGAGGATLAAELAEAGARVLIFEEGGFWDTRSFGPRLFEAATRLYRAAGTEQAHGPPDVLFLQGRCVGGSTVINGGMSWRTPERVLERWGREHGIPAVDPESMAPIFERLEALVHVGPQAPDTIGRDQSLFRLGAERRGLRVVANRRNQRQCVGSNNCVFGCPTGGKQSMLVSMLPRALGFGAELYADCRVQRLLVHERGGRPRIEGLIARLVDPRTDRPGPPVRVRARHVVLSCGATQTPVLLLRNRVACGSGQVGRHLTLHPNAKAIAIFEDAVHPWRGVHQAYQVHERLEEGILLAAPFLQPQILALTLPRLGARLWEVLGQIERVVSGGVLVEDSTSGRVLPGPFGSARMRYRMTRHDLDRCLRGLALLCEIYFAAGAQRIVLPIHGLEEITSPDEIRRLFAHPLDPRDIEIATVHAMGSCRMGIDPHRAVVDAFGESHEVRGLWIADASVLPTPVGVNPMLTIMALATRTAFFLRQRLGLG